MIDDARSVHGTIDADVCIVGAGPAGLTLALELDGLGLDVCVLESGDRGITDRGQELAGGENGDPHYYRLGATRIRAFAGTSNHWRPDSGFRGRPLDAVDLAPRPRVDREGWPITRDSLGEDYARAVELCGLGPSDFGLDRWRRPEAEPLVLPAHLASSYVFQIGPLDAWTRRWDDVRRSTDVRLLTHATVLELRSRGDEVTSAWVTAGDGASFDVRAQVFVLAGGGISNARLLLLSARERPAGLGNHHDQVGRYFMEHPHVRSGVFVPSSPAVLAGLGMYRRHAVDGTEIVAMLGPSPEALDEVGALGSMWSIDLVPRARLSEAGRMLSEVRDVGSYRRYVPGTARRAAALLRRPVGTLRAVRAARSASATPEVGMLHGMTEQEPNPHSRVTLGARRDRYGQPVARVDWRLTDRDRHAIRAGQDVLDRALREAGLGHVDDRFGERTPVPLVGGGFHHMGTTRMHDDERRGVVDRHQRVHSMSNLHVTGTSVFTTGGVANPTLTVVALAVRLARHLRQELGAAS